MASTPLKKTAEVAPRSSPRIAAKVRASEELLRRVQEADLANKETIAAEGLAKLIDMPARLPEIDDLEAKLTDAQKEAYKGFVAKNTKSFEQFLKKRREQNNTIDAIRELFTIGATDLALLIFGPKRVALWEAKYGLVRDIFEIAEVDAQCNNTIGELVPGTTPCWICGMPIFHLSAELPRGADNGLSPECEHILPVAQAAIFLQLYDKSNVENELYGLEYDWSHKTCNQIKNADVYFKKQRGDTVLGPGNVPVPDEDAFARLLEEIYKSDRADAKMDKTAPHARTGSFSPDLNSFRDTLQDWIHFNYPETVKQSVKAWKESRIAVFKEKYGAILNFIGGHNYQMSPELYILSLAAAPAQIITRQDENRRVPKGQRSERALTLGFRPSASIISAPGQPPAPPIALLAPDDVALAASIISSMQSRQPSDYEDTTGILRILSAADKVPGGRRTRRRTRSFLPHRRRRSHHAI
jgi:hypothetical protein